MRNIKIFLLVFSMLILSNCSIFSLKTTVETNNNDDKLAPTGSFISPQIEEDSISFGVNVNDIDDTITKIAILLKESNIVIDEITNGINTNGETDNLRFENLDNNKIYKLILVVTYNDTELHVDEELDSYSFTISEEDVEPTGRIMDFSLDDDVVNFSVELIDVSNIITSTKAVLKKDTETISEIKYGIASNGITKDLTFGNLEQNTTYEIELIVTYTFNGVDKTQVLATQSFTTEIWLGAAISTSIKIDGVTFVFEVENEDKVKLLKIVNKNTNQEHIVENNTITLPANYNQTYSYDIKMIDNNNNETILKSMTIKPGTNLTPYEISNAEDLEGINSNLEAVYKLTDDIDLSNENWLPIAPNNEQIFTGVLDGNGYEIKNLTMAGEHEIAGLFGINSGEIKNVKLVDVNIDIDGEFAGGIAFGNYDGTISNSYVSGEISAEYVGGLVVINIADESEANITNSYTDVLVSGTNVGGMVAQNHGNIINSFAIGDVNSFNEYTYTYTHAGGLVGLNEETGIIRNSYAIGNLTSTVEKVNQGGLVGTNIGKIYNSFATGDVEATDYTGGLVGRNIMVKSYKICYGEVINSYRFNGQIIKSNKYKNELGEDAGISELTSSQWYRSTLGWDNNWNETVVSDGYYPVHSGDKTSIKIPTTYPLGSIGNPIEITTKQELIDINNNLYFAYKLMSDIDLSGEDWVPIGSKDTPFTGVFDGNGYTISNLTITFDDEDDIDFWGLFGSSYSTIKNVKLENISVNGNKTSSLIRGGGIVGYNEGNLLNSYVTGNMQISAFMASIGGLVGTNVGHISNTYSDVNISLIGYSVMLGGLAGENIGVIENSFALNEISGLTSNSYAEVYVGGLVGRMDVKKTNFNNNEIGEINNSFVITNVQSDDSAGRLVGTDETVGAYITNSYYYENQTIKDLDENDIIPVDNDFEDIIVVTNEELNDEDWYKNILNFNEEIWDLSQIPDILFE